MNPSRSVRLAFLLAVVFATLAAYALSRWWFPYRPSLRPVTLNGEWITTAEPGHSAGFFRKTFQIPSNVKHAWMAISACEAFEVIVNGDTVGRQFLWRPTRPFQNGLSETGQKINLTQPALGLNYPREYQWEGHRNYLLPTFFDLRPFLQKGKNTIAVSLESRRAPARFLASGEVLLCTGERIAITSDTSWKAEPAPLDTMIARWSDPECLDQEWRQAVAVDAPPGTLLASFAPEIFTEPFEGEWLRPAQKQATAHSVWFETQWRIDRQPRDAWIRMASNRHYDIFINGERVTAAAPRPPDLDAGEWIIGTQRSTDLPTQPELLDPDEVAEMFPGTQYENPPHSDPTVNDFHPYENTLNRTRDRPDQATSARMPGDLEAVQEKGGESQEFAPSQYVSARRTPLALTKNRQLGAFNSYSIAWMLHPGINTIAVRLHDPDPTLNWAAQFAMDGAAVDRAGKRTNFEAFPDWSVRSQEVNNTFSPPVAAVSGGAARDIPRQEFRGTAYNPNSKLIRWGIVWFLSLAGVLGAVWWTLRWRPGAASGMLPVMIVAIGVLAAGLLVEFSWGERHEIIWFLPGGLWAVILGLSLATGGVAAARVFWSRDDRLAASSRHVTAWLGNFPNTTAWRFLLIWVLMACAFLRIYRLDFQPLDDDEYATTQAVLAIAEHGTPKYTEEVFYTRSPLYHYLAGGMVKLLGPNIWALRLPSALAAVATAWLIYLCGARLLRSPWVGLAAMVLFTIHPYAIFSGHLSRFYQQQQFFSLLAVYWFCRGFVTEQDIKYRYLTLAAFVCAVLSQELSLLLGMPILVGYILFAEHRGWRNELKFVLAGMCAVGLIAANLVVFQTRCLTRVDGLSPNIEATLSPHFSDPLNFLSLFMAYSRLHLALSILFVIGLPFAVRDRNRNALALYLMLFSGIIFTNLCVSAVSLRYQYWLLPIWILMGLFGTKSLFESVQRLASRGEDRHGWVMPSLAALAFTVVVLSWSPWRLVAAYDTKILGDAASAFSYVRTQLREGDAVMATEPHPHAGLLETGRINYDLSLPLLYDFVYTKDGRMIDRNGSAQAVSSLAELQAACIRHRRLWVLINREKFRTRGANIRWEYPGGRVELFFRQNFELKFHSYLWDVFLWDADRGRWHNFRGDPG